ncbi:D-alanyl-D-alanine carboxypeptidase family protein [Microbacterium fluvii]|uniref:D-alanyl-D-alanine carboxypeptidase family protein n=1 Tax=Microbacterium fluvii TaxID=415215 RepID=A0ABW2HDV4_9MICO|nr:D-alanyl-D-alanine carboxypeptidase [Microbacterium fluvii]MCU4672927.1 D-alanyl-D-alanine carboxypeptidase [Microbacterium fluvii]
MTQEETPPTRRRRREQEAAREAESTPVDPDDEGIDDELPVESSLSAAPVLATASAPSGDLDVSGLFEQKPRTAALTWVDENTVVRPLTKAEIAEAASPYIPVTADLLTDDEPLRSPLRRRIALAITAVVLIVAAYAAATLLWPLTAVTPTAEAVTVTSAAAPASAAAWPADGTAAVAVEGIDQLASANDDVLSIASITKVVTAMLVLEAAPLAEGESGDAFSFTYADSQDYWAYLYRNESALDVPVGGTLTELQLLQGMLIGSANNYADRLASEYWSSDRAFVKDAKAWLAEHDLSGITITDPTGIDAGNTADAASLVHLGELAMQNPVFAEIVGTESIELPGAGEVENTNELLADSGVLGIKTGWLEGYNLLSAREIVVGTTPVVMYAAVLGQTKDEDRFDTSRDLYLSVQKELVPMTAVPAGTVVGTVETAWGEQVDAVTTADAQAILWNGASATTEATLDLGSARSEGAVIGSLAVTGPLDDTTVEVALAGDIEDPSAWWRLTHPLQLWGLVG